MDSSKNQTQQDRSEQIKRNPQDYFRRARSASITVARREVSSQKMQATPQPRQFPAR